MAHDAIDDAILSILQFEGRITNAELAQRVGLTPGPTLARVNKLESAGVIQGYAAQLDREEMGWPITAFVAVILHQHGRGPCGDFVRAVSDLPEVLECHHIAGAEDYLLKVVAQSPRQYEEFVMAKLTAIPVVQRINTTIVLSTAKETLALPIAAPVSGDPS